MHYVESAYSSCFLTSQQKASEKLILLDAWFHWVSFVLENILFRCKSIYTIIDSECKSFFTWFSAFYLYGKSFLCLLQVNIASILQIELCSKHCKHWVFKQTRRKLNRQSTLRNSLWNFRTRATFWVKSFLSQNAWTHNSKRSTALIFKSYDHKLAKNSMK